MEVLRNHIHSLGIPDRAFAERVGISRSYLSQILSGARSPSRELIQRIDMETHGAVPPSTWFDANWPKRVDAT